jgi:hypothetical protein
VIHYHGSPITPDADAVRILAGRHAMVSFGCLQQWELALDICQSVTADNGAFPLWRAGKQMPTWQPFYEFVSEWQHHPAFDWALIPDVIDGTEAANDQLIAEWPFGAFGVPIWHLNESIEKLARLCIEWPRVALGSSGAYAQIGTTQWWERMSLAMAAACDGNGQPRARLHGLRMLDPEIFTRFPFASADSTNVARNVGIDGRWRGTYLPPNKAVRGIVLAERIEAHQSAPRWAGYVQPAFELAYS